NSIESVSEITHTGSLSSTWSVPIEGGTPAPFPTATWGSVSPDGRWFVYGIEEEVGAQPYGSVLYSYPMAGGTPIRLGPSVEDGTLFGYAVISPDSRTVIYAI